jgi:predicted GTPase
MRRKVIIIGAAGRDFHNFNTRYRDDEAVEVVAGRRFPPELSGPLYPDGIPIHAEEDLPRLIEELGVDECAFSYSDVSYEHVMRVSAVVMAAGASFTLLGPTDTQIHSTKPVVAVCAVRTGAGKSQTARKVVEVLMSKGLKVVAIRHPMPYGNLVRQKVQRFAEVADLERHECTIEEMEEYEPHIVRGNVIYAGNDYEAIVRAAENDPDGCDVIVWDGGNNDVAFYGPDLLITVADPHRPGHELGYYPGEVNFRRADVIVINKMKTASPDGIAEVKANIEALNPTATVVEAASPAVLADPSIVTGKRVLVVEDGPTLTHGGMKIGAGVVAATQHGAVPRREPRRDVRDLSGHRHRVARDGIRDRSDEGPAGDDRRHRM